MTAATTYTQLVAGINDLAQRVAQGAEAVRAKARDTSEEAKDTGRIAAMLASLKVDTATVGETNQLGQLLNGLDEVAIAYAAAADTTTRTAHAAGEQARTTHAGVNEAVRAAAGRTPGIYEVSRDWVSQE